MTEPIFYVNGRFVPAGQASLPLNDLGIVRGYGIFDLLRTYEYRPFRLHDHLVRLQNSAVSIGLEMPWTEEELQEVVLETHARNDFPNASIRIIVTGGSSSDYMTPQGNPSLVVMVTPLTTYPDDYFTRGCKVTTCVMVRERPTVKSLNYMGAIQAVEAAKKQGAVEAVYRTADGHVTEGTRANFFIFRDGKLITPNEGVLAGITRKVVLEIAPDLCEVVERPILYAELADADEAFLTSTTKEVLPIVEIDEITVGDGQVGPQTQRLLEIFRTYAMSPAAVD